MAYNSVPLASDPSQGQYLHPAHHDEEITEPLCHTQGRCIINKKALKDEMSGMTHSKKRLKSRIISVNYVHFY